ncbi:ATP-binding cassette domain-containing protein [Pedobacter foliorum]|uniref:ATP-binding cassette domain-containing protein n=1 Tax=Pedobacter foliorum TaxID=2739058 RepID=UPI001564DAE8|nr:ATP-binding cassette domain-containing protein [Pedobacter foliorum]NRF39461.1 ATP-binding cassette domain-containing protein [Pedobacter foliorum]
MSTIIKTTNLDYAFSSKEQVLFDVNLEVPTGSIYGFLGPNGAGKTTTLKLLLGLLQTRNSNIKIFDKGINDNRIAILKKIGSLIEQPSLYHHLSGYENLEVFALSYNISPTRIKEVLGIVGLSGAADKKVRAYSLGMKQRLAIALALLHDPELLILDEPTNGLDPNGIIEIRELLKHLNQKHHKTILISSHLLSEVEKIASDVGIIHNGKLLFQGSLIELQHLQSNHSFIEARVNSAQAAKDLLATRFKATLVGDTLRIAFKNDQQIAEINQTLALGGIMVYQLRLVNHDLEELFMKTIAE